MADKHLCVAIYMTHDQADEAFSRLQAEGGDMDLLSFVGRDTWKNYDGLAQRRGTVPLSRRSGAVLGKNVVEFARLGRLLVL